MIEKKQDLSCPGCGVRVNIMSDEYVYDYDLKVVWHRGCKEKGELNES